MNVLNVLFPKLKPLHPSTNSKSFLLAILFLVGINVNPLATSFLLNGPGSLPSSETVIFELSHDAKYAVSGDRISVKGARSRLFISIVFLLLNDSDFSFN